MELKPEVRLQVPETGNVAQLLSGLVTSEVCLLCTQLWGRARGPGPQSEWRTWEGWQEVGCSWPAMGAQLEGLALGVLSLWKLHPRERLLPSLTREEIQKGSVRQLTAQAHTAPMFPACQKTGIEGLYPGKSHCGVVGAALRRA